MKGTPARRILIVNDDGVDAPGILLLTRIMERLGHEVWVVAPHEERSGAGHSVSVSNPVRMTQLDERRFSVRGTPTDCVIMGIHEVLTGRPPDILLAGINQGANLAEDITYSGTASAAMEGALLGIPSIALNQVSRFGEPVHWEVAETYTPIVLEKLMAMDWGLGSFVNVNFPSCALAEVSGIRATAQGLRPAGAFRPVKRVDEYHLPYYWIRNLRERIAELPGTDLEAVAARAVSITALQVNMTLEPMRQQIAALLGRNRNAVNTVAKQINHHWDDAMITKNDVDFHKSPDGKFDWGETNFFSFYNVDERILGSIYTVTRQELGVCSSDIIIYGSLAPDRYELLHFDVAQHLPCPEKLSDYHLPNGLHVRVTNAPRDYRIDYTARNGTEIHIDYRGLMDPFDIHDPAVNPRAQGQSGGGEANSGFGSGYRGHWDQSAAVTGEVILGGRRVKIDCVDTMDHSWGPRPEHDMHQMCWMHGHFGEELVIHLILMFHPDRSGPRQYELAHGYVLENGVARAIVAAEVSADRIGRQGVAMRVRVRDAEDRSFEMNGAAIVGGPWPLYMALTCHNTLHRWTTPDGRVGYGVVQDVFSIEKASAATLSKWLAPDRQ